MCLPYCARSHAYDPAQYIAELPEDVGYHGRRVLILGHLDVEGITPGSEAGELARGKTSFWPIDAIRSRFGERALMVGGHIHKRQQFNGVQIVGSLESLAFGDDVSPGFLTMEIDS